MESNELALLGGKANLSISTSDIMQRIKDGVIGGEVSGLEVGIVLKKLAKIGEDIFKDKDFKDVIRNETVKSFDGKSYEGYGFKISERTTHTYYDFSVCGDPVYDALATIQAQVKEMLKEREEYLKSLIPKQDKLSFDVSNNDKETIITKLPKFEIVEGDGELVNLKPPIKYATTGLVYTETK